MPFQIPPQSAPALLPTVNIGTPKLNLEKTATKPGQRGPHFNTGISEGTPSPGVLSNNVAGGARTPLSEEVKPIMDTAAMA